MPKAGVIAAVVALVIAIVYVEIRLGEQPTTAPSTPPDNSAIEARLDRIEDMLTRLSPAALPDLPDDLPAEPAPTIDDSEAPTEAAPLAALEKIEKAKEFIARIEAGEVGGQEMNQLWNLLAGSRLHDEALRALVKNAKAHPNDADAQYGVGLGLISKLVGGQVTYVEQGQLSLMADEAFTRALEIDDHHFDARFSKAVSYTHWPEAFGKGPAAIAEFEILRQQSAQDSSIPMLDQVYTNLGIQYRKTGNTAKSREALEEGLRIFPDSKGIQEQLKALGD